VKTEIVLTVRTDRKQERQTRADYAVLAVPAGQVASIAIDPPLPARQHKAFAKLRYGPVTKLLLQFDRRFWRRRGRPLAYGTDLPTGAVWDGNEEQGGRAGILCLMAGGQASADIQALLATEGPAGVAKRLEWLGKGNASVLAARAMTWEHDPWVGGGYAVFDPGYDPALRQWLARPHGRVVFAGEHTSLRWQGYMNGAVESGMRAAAEIQALAWLNRATSK
jgi:monoamine oxidase